MGSGVGHLAADLPAGEKRGVDPKRARPLRDVDGSRFFQLRLAVVILGYVIAGDCVERDRVFAGRQPRDHIFAGAVGRGATAKAFRAGGTGLLFRKRFVRRGARYFALDLAAFVKRRVDTALRRAH